MWWVPQNSLLRMSSGKPDAPTSDPGGWPTPVMWRYPWAAPSWTSKRPLLFSGDDSEWRCQREICSAISAPLQRHQRLDLGTSSFFFVCLLPLCGPGIICQAWTPTIWPACVITNIFFDPFRVVVVGTRDVKETRFVLQRASFSPMVLIFVLHDDAPAGTLYIRRIVLLLCKSWPPPVGQRSSSLREILPVPELCSRCNLPQMPRGHSNRRQVISMTTLEYRPIQCQRVCQGA